MTSNSKEHKPAARGNKDDHPGGEFVFLASRHLPLTHSVKCENPVKDVCLEFRVKNAGPRVESKGEYAF